MISDVEHLSCASLSPVCLLCRNIYLDILLIFDWVVYIELHEAFICFRGSSLSVTLQIFSPILWVVFCSVFSFAVQKLLIRSHLFIFVFVFITLWGKSKKILLWFTSECPASKSFIVSGLVFSSLIHLSLFLYMVLENVLISKGLNLLAQSTKCSIIHPAFLFKLIYSTLTLDFLKQSIHLMSQYLSRSLFNILPGKLLLILEE